MGTFIFFVTTVIFFIAYLTVKSDFKEYKLKQERLLKKLEKAGLIEKINKNEKTDYDDQEKNIIQNMHEDYITQENIIQDKRDIANTIIQEKKVKTKQDNKINWLFGIGISLFCITYFVLITSTWSVISDGLKCILVLLFSGLFFGSSLILEKIIKAPKATIVFWSLGLIYVPFSLIALFGFGLLGNYLSFGGQGSNLCLTIIAFISLILNLCSTLKFKKEIFGWLYILSELLTIFMGIRIFTVDYTFNLLVLSIYLALVVITLDFFKNNKLVELFERPYSIYKDILLNILNIVIFASTFVFIITSSINITFIISLLIITILNMYISISKSSQIYGLIGLYLFVETIFSVMSLVFKQTTFEMYAVVYSICNIVFIIIRNLLYNNEKESMFCEIVKYFAYINIIILTTIILFNGSCITLMLIPIILILISIILLLRKDADNVFFTYLFPIVLALSVIRIVDIFNNLYPIKVYNTLVLISMCIMFLIVTFVHKNEFVARFKKAFYIIIPVIVIIEFLISLDGDDIIQKLIYSTIATIMYIVVYLNSQSLNYSKFAKVIASILSYLVILLIALEILEPLLAYTIVATIYLIMTIFTKEILKNFKNCFNIISAISIFVGLVISIFEFENYMIWYYIVSVIAFIYYANEYKDSINILNFFKICSLLVSNLATVCAINYLANLLQIHNIVHTSIFINTLIISLVLLYKKKMTKLNVIYLFLFNIISVIQLNAILNGNLLIKLLPSLSYIVLLLLQLPYINEKMKDFYKAVIYVVFLIPYSIIINYFDITFIALNTLICMSIIYLISRTVLNKYMANTKVLEIIAVICIYIYSLISANVSFNQAIMLDILLAIIIILSYLKQENYLFKLTSISFILIVFIQTKTVNFPIVWLICLLLFGISFITFATISEIKNKNNQSIEEKNDK